MKHYRVVYKPLYAPRGDGKIEDIGGFYWIQKRSFLFCWKDYEQVPQYLSLRGEDAALYHCNMLEGQLKIRRLKKYIKVKEK